MRLDASYTGFLKWHKEIKSVYVLTPLQKLKIKEKINRDYLRQFNHFKTKEQ